MRMKAQLAAGLLATVAASSAGALDDPAPHTHTLPLVLAAGPGLHGFVRVINHSGVAGTVRVEAIDDAGVRFGPVTLDIRARHVVAADGPNHHHGAFFNPEGNPSQVSQLRIADTTTVADRRFPKHECDDPSAVVSIPDEGLRGAVEEALGKAPGAAITQGELAGLTHLMISVSRQIQSLKGLECAVGLTDLSLFAGNQVTDLTPLADLTTLTGLWLVANQLTDISPLAGLTALEILELSDNQITDLTPVAGLTGLTWLAFDFNQLGDLTPLVGLTALTELYLGENQISDISPLVRNSGLGSGDEIYLDGNPLNAVSRNTHIPALRARGVSVYE